MTLREHLAAAERDYLLSAYRRHNGNRVAACHEAGVSQATFYRRLSRKRSGDLVRVVVRKNIPHRIETLMEFFGLPGGRRWRSMDLAVVHHDARERYRAMATAAHPDRGGSHEMMARVNEAWRRLEGALRRHGWRG